MLLLTMLLVIEVDLLLSRFVIVFFRFLFVDIYQLLAIFVGFIIGFLAVFIFGTVS